MNRFFPLLRALGFLALLAVLAGPAVPVHAKGKVASPTAPLFQQEEQDALTKAEVLAFLRTSPGRNIGEGYLFLARHYRELDQPERAMEFLKTLVRSDPIDAEYKAEAQLLLAEILLDRKEYDLCLKELERLISWGPDRPLLVRAKIARARLLGRGLTRIDDLFKAYRRYYERFPEMPEDEELRYLMGFERGYDLEIGMKGLNAWEEIQGFPEREAADLARLHIALYYSYDLSKPDRGQEWLARIPLASPTASGIDRWFVEAALNQFHLPQADLALAAGGYRDYIAKTRDLNGWRVAHLTLGSLLRDRLDDPAAAIEVFADLASIPPHLVATPSSSLKKRAEGEGENSWWEILGSKMAGYTAEYRLEDIDRARFFYERAATEHKAMIARVGGEPDPWLRAALERVEPRVSPAQRAFDQAYEKYRSRDFAAAIAGFEGFIASYPRHPMAREALYRMAVLVDNDFRQYDRALELYRQYVARGGSPLKSAWKLDKLYDWGRLDEVRYRIGNLRALHRRDPIGAIDVFRELIDFYPDSYWSMQALKDIIDLQQETLGDENAAQESMKTYVQRFPDDKGSQDYRKILFERLLAQNHAPEALAMLREFLDRSEPSEKGYLEYKKLWRELSFRQREAEIRNRLKTAGDLDRQSLYVELISVLSQASSSAPLSAFLAELEEAEIPDELRWSLGYRIGCELYREFPAQAKETFEKLADTASGTPRLACALTLGNLAWRVGKSSEEAMRWYETAASLTTPLDPIMETPTYRMARLTLLQGDGILALERLTTFIRRFPRSRHLAKAYFALGEAYAALHHPRPAKRFLARAARLSPALAPKVSEKMEQLARADEPGAWLLKQAKARSESREQAARLKAMRERMAAEGVTGSAAAALGLPELFTEPGAFTDDRETSPGTASGSIGRSINQRFPNVERNRPHISIKWVEVGVICASSSKEEWCGFARDTCYSQNNCRH